MEAERIKLSNKLPGDVASPDRSVVEHQPQLLRVDYQDRFVDGDFSVSAKASLSFSFLLYLPLSLPFPSPCDLTLKKSKTAKGVLLQGLVLSLPLTQVFGQRPWRPRRQPPTCSSPETWSTSPSGHRALATPGTSVGCDRRRRACVVYSASCKQSSR